MGRRLDDSDFPLRAALGDGDRLYVRGADGGDYYVTTVQLVAALGDIDLGDLTDKVTGPASAVNGNPAVFDGITGKIIKQVTYADFKTGLSLIKADVGLGSVDNTSDSDKNAATATLTNKTISAGSNTISNLATTHFAANVIDTDTALAANSDTRLATQKAVKAYADALVLSVGSGNVVGPSSVTDGNPALFDGSTGKLIKQVTYSAFKTALSLAKGDVGLGSVDNTSDATKNSASATLTNKTLTAPVMTTPTLGVASATTLALTGAIGSAAHIDTHNAPVLNIANGASAVLAVSGYGLVVVGESTNSGDVALYLYSAGLATNCVLILAMSSTWVASTTSPAAGKASVAFNGSGISIYNGTGGARDFRACVIRIV